MVCVLRGRIYCASQENAKIVSYIKENQYVGLKQQQIATIQRVCGEGNAQILEQKGQEVLDILIDKYLGKKQSNLSRFLQSNSKTEVTIEIIPSRIYDYGYSERMKDVQ